MTTEFFQYFYQKTRWTQNSNILTEWSIFRSENMLWILSFLNLLHVSITPNFLLLTTDVLFLCKAKGSESSLVEWGCWGHWGHRGCWGCWGCWGHWEVLRPGKSNHYWGRQTHPGSRIQLYFYVFGKENLWWNHEVSSWI